MSRLIPLSRLMPDAGLNGFESASATPVPRPSPRAYVTADYIHDMTSELGQIATEAGLDLLAYLLEMVKIEARLVKLRTKTDTTAPDVA